jgi:hypothetical protein
VVSAFRADLRSGRSRTLRTKASPTQSCLPPASFSSALSGPRKTASPPECFLRSSRCVHNGRMRPCAEWVGVTNEKMSHLMRDRAAEQERGLRPRLCGDGMDAARIDRDQDAATAAAVDQRISKTDVCDGTSPPAVLCKRSTNSPVVRQNLGTRFAGVVVRDPANSPLQGKPCVLEIRSAPRARPSVPPPAERPRSCKYESSPPLPQERQHDANVGLRVRVPQCPGGDLKENSW